MKMLVQAAALVMILFGMASAALAAEKPCWVGREEDNKRVFWSCINTEGSSWTLSRNSVVVGAFETTNVTDEFIEMKLKTDKDFRLRLYKDRMSMNQNGDRWTTIAIGKWQK